MIKEMVTLPLERYNELLVIEKAINEKKLICYFNNSDYLGFQAAIYSVFELDEKDLINNLKQQVLDCKKHNNDLTKEKYNCKRMNFIQLYFWWKKQL